MKREFKCEQCPVPCYAHIESDDDHYIVSCFKPTTCLYGAYDYVRWIEISKRVHVVDAKYPVYYTGKGFRTLRGVSGNSLIMSHCTNFYDDSITTISEERVSLEDFDSMIRVEDIRTFSNAYLYDFGSYYSYHYK
jgi:hypothetical protein